MPDLRDLPGVLESWQRRKVLPTGVFNALAAEEKAKAFGLATVWDSKLLEALYASLTNGIRDALTSKEWTTEANRILAAFGGEVYSGEEFSAWYADLVFRQNTMTAYNAGRYAEMFSPAWMQRAGFWMYATAEDERVCEICGPLDGKVFAKADAGARNFLPGVHFNCRCQAIELDAEDVRAGEYQVSSSGAISVPMDPDWDVDRVISTVPPELLMGRAA